MMPRANGDACELLNMYRPSYGSGSFDSKRIKSYWSQVYTWLQLVESLEFYEC
jgi:hypothetical protein